MPDWLISSVVNSYDCDSIVVSIKKYQSKTIKRHLIVLPQTIDWHIFPWWYISNYPLCVDLSHLKMYLMHYKRAKYSPHLMKMPCYLQGVSLFWEKDTMLAQRRSPLFRATFQKSCTFDIAIFQWKKISNNSPSYYLLSK